MNWQDWHMNKDEALACIASPAFSHGRANYRHCLKAYEVYLYRHEANSPTGVVIVGSVPDCPEIANAIRQRQSAIEPPH